MMNPDRLILCGYCETEVYPVTTAASSVNHWTCPKCGIVTTILICELQKPKPFEWEKRP